MRAPFVTKPGDTPLFYAVVLEGKLRADRLEADGTLTAVGFAEAGGGFGETPIMHGKESSTYFVCASRRLAGVCVSQKQQFWNLMACCPAVRKMM